MVWELRCDECEYGGPENGLGMLTGDNAGDKGGEVNRGVGSRVESADAPVSPLSSAPRLLDIRRGRGIVSRSRGLDLRLWEGCWCRDAAAKE